MDNNIEKVLGFMKTGAFKPLSLNELMRRLEIPKETKPDFKRLLRGMVVEGDLVKIRGGRYGLPSRMNLVTGELLCHPNGFGFVVPDEGGEDVFINPKNLQGAMHKDKVVVRIEGLKPGGKKEGKIIRILKRAHKMVVGRFEMSKGLGMLVPSNERLLQDIVILPGGMNDAKTGQIVEVEITKWPSKQTAPSGRIVEILGNHDDPDVELEVIVKKYGLPYRFPNDVIKESKNAPKKVLKSDMADRVDLRDRFTVTIDGETAKDFDDAISIEKTVRGYKLWVSIADVSYYVKEGTLLDQEAYKRGTSTYFPDRCIPMLPEDLSNGICSLNPQVNRLAFTAEISFDKDGRPKKKRFYESVINSNERLTYTLVKNILTEDDKNQEERYNGLSRVFVTMKELALKLNANRIADGSIDFDLPEPQIIIDIEGTVEDIARSERNIAHQIIEEFMLSANTAVTEYMATLPFLYRVHDKPNQENIDTFMQFIHDLGYRINQKKKGTRFFQEILTKSKGKPEERLINHILLRSMKQARYSSENIGHFGLGFDNYCHFTSPIRRYPDLVAHRLLKKRLKGNYSKGEQVRWENLLPEIADHTSKMERIAMEAEREAVDLKKVQFMGEKIGEIFNGVISGVTSFGFFVELEEYFVEGLVHISSLVDDYYIYIEREHSLIGEHTKKKYRVGNKVIVRIERVDMERRQIDLALIEDNLPSGRRPRKLSRIKRRRV